jgi:hypothetical protein
VFKSGHILRRQVADELLVLDNINKLKTDDQGVVWCDHDDQVMFWCVQGDQV